MLLHQRIAHIFFDGHALNHAHAAEELHRLLGEALHRRTGEGGCHHFVGLVLGAAIGKGFGVIFRPCRSPDQAPRRFQIGGHVGDGEAHGLMLDDVFAT